MREEVIDGGLTSELALTSAARSHSATYTCHAANAFGRDTRNIELVVQGLSGRVPSPSLDSFQFVIITVFIAIFAYSFIHVLDR